MTFAGRRARSREDLGYLSTRSGLVLAAGLAAVAAAVGIAASGAGGTNHAVAGDHVEARISATNSRPTSCGTSQLGLVSDNAVYAAMDFSATSVIVQNRRRTECVLQGYPFLAFRNANPDLQGNNQSWDVASGWAVIRPGSTKTMSTAAITLAPKAEATFYIMSPTAPSSRYPNCPHPTFTLEIHAKAGSQAYIKISGGGLPGCYAGHELKVSPWTTLPSSGSTR